MLNNRDRTKKFNSRITNKLRSQLILNNHLLRYDKITIFQDYLHKGLICTASLRSEYRSSVAVHEYLLYLCPLVTLNLRVSPGFFVHLSVVDKPCVGQGDKLRVIVRCRS